jgi:hypothetical protein
LTLNVESSHGQSPSLMKTRVFFSAGRASIFSAIQASASPSKFSWSAGVGRLSKRAAGHQDAYDTSADQNPTAD